MNSNCAGPVNLGNPGEFSIFELANKVIVQTKSASSAIFLPLPQDDPLQRKPVIALAQQELGWTPATDLTNGLTETINFFNSNAQVVSSGV
jgi:UDP-glucuronate decarboxylase